VYRRHCATCHGVRGDGEGTEARFLEIPPRDFTRGEYEFRTTATGKPARAEDIYRTITVGVPGTHMPAWGKLLSREERKLLTRYLMALSPRFWRRLEVADALEFPEEPVNDAASVATGNALYVKMQCAQCHGARGRGDGPSQKTLKDDWGHRLRAWNFTKGYFQGGRGAAVVFRAISTGLSGTPMPSYVDQLTPEECWHLAHYVLSLAGERGAAAYLFSDPAGRQQQP
jgi:mono/diheme cytochrome c family protein